MDTPPPYPCLVDDCDATVLRPELMCPQHWTMIPAALQTSLMATYRPGQEVDGDASTEHLAYVKAAKADIAHKQRRQRRGPRKPTQLALFELQGTGDRK